MEYGSDFHFPGEGAFGAAGTRFWNAGTRFYADGRCALNAVLSTNREAFKRVWMPEYFCGDVVEAVKATGLPVEFYPDFPGADDVALIRKIPFREGDVLLRMNFFGLRDFRGVEGIPVPVVEDHSHDLFSSWARRSEAEFCFASMRKILPLPQGGAAWSSRFALPEWECSEENRRLESRRFSAMSLKGLYLKEKSLGKELFRELLTTTESELCSISDSGIGEISSALIRLLDFHGIHEKKKNNWNRLAERLSERVEFLKPENMDAGTPFSFVVRAPSETARERLRTCLIANEIFPAVLWRVPETVSPRVREEASRLLSIHCDFRYSEEQMDFLAEKIEEGLNSD